MTAAVKQFLRDLASVLYAIAAALFRLIRGAIGIAFLFGVLFYVGFIVWDAVTARSPTPEEKARNEEAKQRKQQLCLAAKACKKYIEARLECATAGNFKTCLRIKMGEDSFYSDICGGYDLGAPAVPLPTETPTAFECFFLTLGR
jgi:Ca2+/Na+ antiporter